MSMKCPLCASPTHTKSSRYLNEHIKERYFQCTNLKCSASFRTAEQFVNMISRPAAKEDQPTDAENKAAWDKAVKQNKKVV